jgi:hypothetical protein
MVAKMHSNHTESTRVATRVRMSDAAGLPGSASPKTDRRVHWRLITAWRFTRRLLEMVLAMLVGMALLEMVIGALGEPPGYSNLMVEYAFMGASMSASMVAWMRYRGHPWSDGTEMTTAMLVPTFALVLPIELGIVRLTGPYSVTSRGPRQRRQVGCPALVEMGDRDGSRTARYRSFQRLLSSRSPSDAVGPAMWSTCSPTWP